MKYERILVTGGYGFIGSEFVRQLDERNFARPAIAVMDCVTYAANHANLARVGFIERFESDISETEEVEFSFHVFKPDLVVNFAAESHVDRSIDSSAGFVRSNIVGVQVLLDACRRHGVKRFVQIGTDEVYGDLAPGDSPSTESDRLKPSSPYSASKTAADLLALSYHRTFGLDVVVTRSSNNYGTHQYPEKLIPLMILKALRGENLPVYGDGRQVRDWLHVADNCRGILAAIEKGEAGAVYNLGGDNQTANIDIVRLILATLGVSSSLIEYVKDRPGHDRRYALDCSMAKTDLEWHRQVSFKEGIVNTVEWYRTHKEWWAPLLEKGATKRRGH